MSFFFFFLPAPVSEYEGIVDSIVRKGVIGAYTSAHAKGKIAEGSFIINEHLVGRMDKFPGHSFWKNYTALRRETRLPAFDKSG